MAKITVEEYSQNQFGKVVENDSIKDNMEAFAEVFSEGSPALKNLLLYLWNHGIKTKACCTGHMFQPAFRKKILWFEKSISEKEYIKNQEKKSYRKYFVSHPGYLCFYYTSDDMMKSAHALKGILSQKCPDIKLHISFSYEEISIYLDEVLYPKDTERFFQTALESFNEWHQD